jgi:hypothetical protein
MGYRTKADDWEVAGIMSVGGGVGIGGGVWLFEFESSWADCRAVFAFGGLGAAAGGLGGVSAPDFTGQGSGGLVWSKVGCLKKFSAADLNYAGGTVKIGGIGVMAGYGLVWISASTFGGFLFSLQPCHGATFGVSTVAAATLGVWKWLDSGNARPTVKQRTMLQPGTVYPRHMDVGWSGQPSTATISAPVGRGGVNRFVDVVTVQDLLNEVPGGMGGPAIVLAVDGKCGPKTVAAIQGFQLHHFGWKLADGRVDPTGPTIGRLCDTSDLRRRA